MDYDHVKKQLGYGIQTESKDNAIKAIEQLTARVRELEEEIERLKEIEQTNDTLLDQLGDKNAVLLDQVADLKEENRVERNLRVGVEHGFDCANEQIGLLRLLIDEQKAELAKYRDAPVVAWRFELKPGEYAFCSQKNAEANNAMLTPENHAVQLIVKPGE